MAPIPTGGKCGPDNMYCGGLPGDTPTWREAGWKFVPPDVRRKAELAYNHLLNDPLYFAEIFTTQNWMGKGDESVYLEIFAEYSTLATTAEQLLLQTIGLTYGSSGSTYLTDTRYACKSGSETLNISSVVGGGMIAIAAVYTFAGRGSTGDSRPRSDAEREALETVKSNPGIGHPLKITMQDPTWPAGEGWIKMEYSHGSVTIHYLLNRVFEEWDDPKFIR